MLQSPFWEINGLLASQEILCNLKFHCRVRYIPPLAPISIQKNSVHTLTLHFIKFGSYPIIYK
jgi:hypothetical protein